MLPCGRSLGTEAKKRVFGRCRRTPTNAGATPLVDLCYGKTLASLDDSLILGPRGLAALIRDCDLNPQLKSAIDC